MALPSNEQVTEKLTAVIDPELRRNIVELGMVRSIDVKDDGRVEVVVSLTTPGCPVQIQPTRRRSVVFMSRKVAMGRVFAAGYPACHGPVTTIR